VPWITFVAFLPLIFVLIVLIPAESDPSEQAQMIDVTPSSFRLVNATRPSTLEFRRWRTWATTGCTPQASSASSNGKNQTLNNDGTGVGVAVTDLLKGKGLSFTPVTITGGDAARDLGKERIGQVGHQNADILGQLPVLVHGIEIRAVVVALQRLLDPRPRRGAHAAGIVEIFRDGRTRNAAQGCEFFHVPDSGIRHDRPSLPPPHGTVPRKPLRRRRTNLRAQNCL
jgi:hypothetical protein